MRKLLCIGWLTLLFSCGKKKTEPGLRDFSLQEKLRLNKVVKLGDHCFIVGGDRFTRSLLLQKAEGQGAQRITMPAGSTQKELYGIDVGSDGHLMAVGYDGSVYASKDSGQTWTFEQNNSWREFQAVALRNADSAVVVGGLGFEKGFMLPLSSDGKGDVSTMQERNFELTDVVFPTPNVGYMSGYGCIMKSADGGRIWQFTGAINDYFKAMCWRNEAEGVAVGYNGSILQTNDGGLSWQTRRNGNTIWQKQWRLLDVAAGPTGLLAAVGEKGLLVFSTDGGSTWQEADSGTKLDLRGLVFLRDHTLLVVGEQGCLLEVDLP